MFHIAVIGGGISGLAVAFRLKRAVGYQVTVLEAEDRPGGKAHTEVIDGFTCEAGTNSWLDKEQAARDLLEEAGISDRIKPASQSAERRFIYRANQLREVKLHPLKFMTSSVLPLGARLRLALEPFVAKQTQTSDETLADFATRRLGKGACDILIGPMASGIYAGDPNEMSLKSCFNKVYQLEQQHGGLIKGMLALKKAKKAAGEDPSAVTAGPSGRITSLEGGVSDLVQALTAEIGTDLKLGARVLGIAPGAQGGFTLHIEGSEPMTADAVVTATPAWSAAEYLKQLDPDAATAFSEIPYPSLDVICLGYHKNQVPHDLHGFGFLVPRGQDKTILGSLWTSSIFPGRAPQDHVLMRTMIGGMLEPQVGEWPPERVIATVREELSAILGIPTGEAPVLTRIFRHPRAIPQYHVGHAHRVARIRAAESRHPGFFATGNALLGVGVIDCIRESVATAHRVSLFLGPAKT
ncbi:MAG: protoporphyrinogen oxidase [Myxococcota bacterium]|nr:protoporphyrinogen oxidase [Myxococcota bacterium]